MNLETIPIANLYLDPANLRKHPERNLDAIKASLVRFGQQRPILIDARGVVRAGNGTLLAAKELGWETLEAVRSDLLGSEATAYAIADNRTAELAEWEAAALAQCLTDLLAEDFDLEAAGFNGAELDELIAAVTVPTSEEWSDATGAISAGEKSPFKQITFTISEDQAAMIQAALKAAKDAGPFVDTGNLNSNGNAITRIAEAYLALG